MSETYSNAVRTVIQAAEEAATDRGQCIVGSEHILYALLGYDQYLPARVLASLGLSVEAMRAQVELILARHQASASGPLTYSSEAQSALTAAAAEADMFEHDKVGAEDLLLGLIREGGEAVSDVFDRFGVEVDGLRERVGAFLFRRPGPDAERGRLTVHSSTDSPALMGMIQELAETRTARQQRIDEGDADAALVLRAREKDLLQKIAQQRALG
jgi:ATP-dependent Clp protease ATP-binding subunit ClpC